MPKPWEQRFPNVHTRPDLDDPLIRKTCADAKTILGRDALEEEIDFPTFLAELQRKHCSPEYQAAVAERCEDEELRLARERGIEQRRHIEKLSPFHVDAIRSGCDAELRPLTTTEIQRMVIDQWDGLQSMFLLGDTGIGKTYTATWCAMRAIRDGRSAAGTTAIRICEASPDQLALLRSVSLLVLDQLHTLRSPAGKNMPAWQVGPVIEMINHRYEQQRITIGAGTIGPEAMVDLLGEDVRRRFPVRLSSKLTDVRHSKGGTENETP